MQEEQEMMLPPLFSSLFSHLGQHEAFGETTAQHIITEKFKVICFFFISYLINISRVSW